MNVLLYEGQFDVIFVSFVSFHAFFCNDMVEVFIRIIVITLESLVNREIS